MATTRTVKVRVNGVAYEQTVEARKTLVDFLREDVGLTGTNVGCEHGVCGACTILMNGEAVRSCIMLAAQADGAELMTVEGLAKSQWRAPSDPRIVSRKARTAVRLLHAGVSDDDLRAVEQTPRRRRRRNQGMAFGAPLPVHRLPGYFGIGKIGGIAAAQSLARPSPWPPPSPSFPANCPSANRVTSAKTARGWRIRLLLTGRVEYGNDIRTPGMLHAAILRSPHAHARIKSIDTSRAEKLPGVAAVLTGKEVKDWSRPVFGIPEGWTGYALAVEKTHWVGEPVAVVAASDRYIAEDALELIEIEYEPLEPVVDALTSRIGIGTEGPRRQRQQRRL